MFRIVKETLYRYLWGRWLIHHYGRSVWKLPRQLRKSICFDEEVVGFPYILTREYRPSELFSPPSLDIPAPTLGHRLVDRPYYTKSAHISRLDNAWLVGKHAAVVTDHGRVLLSAFRNEPRILGLEQQDDLVDWLTINGWSSKSSEPWADVCSFVGRLDTNYYHWIAEICSQVEGLEMYEKATRVIPTVLIRRNGPKFQRDSLRLLGIDEDRLRYWDCTDGPRQVKRLVVASRSGNVVGCAPASLKWLRTRFLAGAGVENSRPAQRLIYIPRPPGGWRSVLNNQEVEQCLTSRGFEMVQPDRLAFGGQVRLFSEARLIVGMHGAALANLLFAPSTALVELFGRYGNGTYYNLCSGLGRPYFPMKCREMGEDIEVDLAALLRVIDRILA